MPAPVPPDLPEGTAPINNRMELLPNNPGTIRDTATEKNYHLGHLGSHEEAAELALIINGLDAYAKFMIESYEEEIAGLKEDLRLEKLNGRDY